MVERFGLFKSISICESFDQRSNLIVHAGVIEEFLQEIPDEAIRLIVTSPPYNIGKEYEYPILLKDYLAHQASIIRNLSRVLAENGSICWQVGNYVDKGEVFPLDIHFYPIFKELGLKLRNRIIWHFGHGLHGQKRFSGRYETILWFTKTDKYVFNLDSVRIKSKYPGKTNHKGPNRGKISGNPLGKNPSDVWEVLLNDWEEMFWDIPNVKANHPEKTIHPCQFPVELVQRCVLALTNENDWVLDPYAGVGSSIIAALMHDRKAIGCEKENKYVAIAKDRVNKLINGELKVRPLGKPVYQPTGREKVSQIPLEWIENH